MNVKPRLDILPEPQKILWSYLGDTPKAFVLYGGTAIALRYGHRQSIDFDFFTTRTLDLEKITKGITYLNNFKCFLDVHSEQFYEYYVKVKDNEHFVKITFVTNNGVMPRRINTPDVTDDNNIQIASPLDLMVGKIFALQGRQAQKDFFDLGELILHGVSLQQGFEAAYAINKYRPKAGPLRLDFHALQWGLASKEVAKMLPDSPERIDAIRHAASSINMERVVKTKIRTQKYLDAP